jgi:hypothetical protein
VSRLTLQGLAPAPAGGGKAGWGRLPSSPRGAMRYGPSPRAWGLQATIKKSPGGGRSIPTDVGTTRAGPGWPRGGSVHPHGCGDYAARSVYTGKYLGPSPRAWGLRLPHRGLRPRRAVHPHVRGDYGVAWYRSVEVTGPSPRAWGLPLPGRAVPPPGRSIPTCVGTTGYSETTPRGGRSIPTCVGTTLANLGFCPSQVRSIPTCVGTTLDQDGKNTLSPPVMCLSGR